MLLSVSARGGEAPPAGAHALPWCYPDCLGGFSGQPTGRSSRERFFPRICALRFSDIFLFSQSLGLGCSRRFSQSFPMACGRTPRTREYPSRQENRASPFQRRAKGRRSLSLPCCDDGDACPERRKRACSTPSGIRNSAALDTTRGAFAAFPAKAPNSFRKS